MGIGTSRIVTREMRRGRDSARVGAYLYFVLLAFACVVFVLQPSLTTACYVVALAILFLYWAYVDLRENEEWYRNWY